MQVLKHLKLSLKLQTKLIINTHNGNRLYYPIYMMLFYKN